EGQQIRGWTSRPLRPSCSGGLHAHWSSALRPRQPDQNGEGSSAGASAARVESRQAPVTARAARGDRRARRKRARRAAAHRARNARTFGGNPARVGLVTRTRRTLVGSSSQLSSTAVSGKAGQRAQGPFGERLGRLHG